MIRLLNECLCALCNESLNNEIAWKFYLSGIICVLKRVYKSTFLFLNTYGIQKFNRRCRRRYSTLETSGYVSCLR
jgi:hypothetical protein